MDIAKIYKVSNAAEEGQWIAIGKDAKVKVRRLWNEDHSAEYRRRLRPFQNMRESARPEEEIRKITIDCLAKHVFVGFKTLVEEGKELKDTLEERRRILDQYELFSDHIIELARNVENFQEDVEKN